MNDFEIELQALIEKHREFPGADYREMYRVLNAAAVAVLADGVRTSGPFASDAKFTGL